MPITDVWSDWSTTAASNPPAGTAVPLMDDEIRNIKAELIKNTVTLSGNQTIAGVKTFSSIPELPGSNPTTANQTARKAYVDLFVYFASGTKLPFYQSAAPTGWTQDTGVNDKVLRVVSTAGGGSGGNWTLSGMSVDSHTLIISEMPVHSHGLGIVVVGGIGGAAVNGAGAGAVTNDAGGGGGHTHGLTNSSWRPAYIDVIVCAKD